MNNADTAIVGNGTFTHYCHKIKGLMMLRVHHMCCPLCLQKNPDYITNNLVYVISNISGSVVMIFGDQKRAIKYIHNHPKDYLVLGDSGFVN